MVAGISKVTGSPPLPAGSKTFRKVLDPAVRKVRKVLDPMLDSGVAVGLGMLCVRRCSSSNAAWLDSLW